MTMLDLLIRGGTVIDGTGAPGFSADVAVEGGVIAAVEPLPPDTPARRVMDAAGKLVATVDCRWILVDLTSGHIMREPNWTVENFWNETVEGELSLHTHRCKELTSAGERRASYSLCDLNGHINNAYYLDLACDALPPEVLQAGPVTFAAVNYHWEIPMGDTVELLYAPSEEGWYVQGRHDGRTSFECYLKIGS